MGKFGLLAPDVLVFCGLPILLGLILFWAGRVRARRAAAFGTRVSAGGIARALVPAALCMLGVLALARPHLGYEEVPVPPPNHDTLIVFDISRSMRAADLHPSRLAAAKRKLYDLIDGFERHDRPTRLGILLFAGEAYLFCPLTADYAVVRAFAEAVQSDLITRQGSALADALRLALDSLTEVKASESALLILSDGEELGFDPGSLTAEARARRISIHAIGVGTDEGAPIEERPGRYVTDRQGQIVLSRLAEGTLRELADATGGIYRRAELGDGDVDEIVSAVVLRAGGAELDASASGETRKIHREVGPLLILAALLAGTLAVIFDRRELVFTSLALFCVARPELARAEPLHEGYRAYQEGDFETAHRIFSEHHTEQPDWKLDQAIASTLYKLEKYEEAARHFESAKGAASNGRELFESHYGLGNARLMLGDLDSAIDEYTTALRIKPGDADTEANLELARRLKAMVPTPTPPPQSAASQSSSQSSSQSETSEGSQSTEGSSGSQGSQSSERSSALSETQQEPGSSGGSSASSHSAVSGEQSSGEDGSASSSSGQQSSAGSSASGQPETGSEQRSSGSAESLSPSEARAWLEALKDAPLLFERRVTRDQPRGGQTW